MKVITANSEILCMGSEADPLTLVEKVARTCYKSESSSTPDKDKKLVENLVKLGHEAMLEFFDITVKFTCSRSIANEIIRLVGYDTKNEILAAKHLLLKSYIPYTYISIWDAFDNLNLRYF